MTFLVLQEIAESPTRVPRRWIALAGGATAVVLAVAGATAYAVAGDVPRGTTVLGIELGGLSRTAAAQALRDGLASRAEISAPVAVRVADQQARLQPANIGLGVDIEATVAAAADGGARFWGTREVAPVVTIDAERLHAALAEPAAKASQAMTMPAVIFTGTTPKPVYPVPGKGLNPDRSAEAVRGGWLRSDAIEVPMVDIHPASTREEVDQLLADLARPAVAAPVLVTTPRGQVAVPPQAIAKSLLITSDASGKLTPKIDEKKLRAALGDAFKPIETAPKDARISLENGAPRVSGSTDGNLVDVPGLSRDLLAVLPRPAPRSLAAAMISVAPKTTTEQIVKLGIKERVSTFTTRFTGGLSSPRSRNIVQAAREVDGALVKPGELFSLNGHTGPRGYAQGYLEAPTIVDGKLVPGVGGGVSQFTTTLFNAAYYAGLEDVEHKPHSFYFTRYPAVIESTIFYPDLDLKFRNTTPYGVMIDTSYTSDSITVTMWSTKVYDSVKTVYSPRRNITQPRVSYVEPGPDCIATDGIPGFTQDAWRVIRKDGREIKREKFTWRYDPEPRFICGRPA
jgi:vancomycin resistance protein YoaR